MRLLIKHFLCFQSLQSKRIKEYKHNRNRNTKEKSLEKSVNK